MSNLPLVSICTPCYNHENYLEDYFKSIIKQTYPNIELIIIDDASKDNSVKIIDKWLPKLNKRFTSVLFKKNNENIGITPNCNELIRNSKGKYIKLFASDDMLHPNYISSCVKFMENNEEIMLCYTNGYYVNNNFKYKNNINNLNLKKIFNNGYYKEDKHLYGKNLFPRLLITECFLYAPSGFTRKYCYEINGMHDETIGAEDFEYLLRITSNGGEIGYIEQNLVYYRISKTSISNNNHDFEKIRFIVNNFEKLYMKYLPLVSNDKRKYFSLFIYSKLLDFYLTLNEKNKIKYYYKKLNKIDKNYLSKKILFKIFLNKIGLLSILLNLKKYLVNNRI